MKSHGNSMKIFHEKFPWNCMKFSMEFHGTEVDEISWNSMEFHEIQF
jgi:hypothetical protein